jgi:ribonuclease HII
MEVCGLDEAGKGPLAGPLVAAAVILRHDINGLNDSKKLSKKMRELLYSEIMRSGAIVDVELISARSINTKGMAWAGKEIFRRLIRRIDAGSYIVDGAIHPGRVKSKTSKIEAVVRADGSTKCVMAASIVAKVTRDVIMQELDKEFPHYNWRINKGYGTKEHITLIKKHGESRYHRSVFVTTAIKNST